MSSPDATDRAVFGSDLRLRAPEREPDNARDDALDGRRRRWRWRRRGWWRRRWKRRRRRRRWRRWQRRRRRRTVVGERNQEVLRAVEDVLVTGEIDWLVAPLPEGVRAPAGRERADVAVPGRDPQWVVGAEAGVVAGALLPPVGRRVDDRPASRPRPVLVDEAVEPRHHPALTQAVAGRAVGVVLDVERAGQRLTVGRPCAAVSCEPVGLGSAGRPIREGEVVRPPHEPDLVGAAVLLREVRIDVGRAFGGLDVREVGPVGGDRDPVHVPLPAAHVEAGQPGGPNHWDGAEVALREPRACVVAVRMSHRAAGLHPALGLALKDSADCRPRHHGAGHERHQREDLPALQTHRAKLATIC